MPVAPVVLAALIGAATTVGTTIYNKVSAPSMPSADDIAKAQAAGQQSPDQAKTQAAQQAARQMQPNVQSMLGGAVSPDYYASVIANQSGNADQLAAVRSALNLNGISAPGQTSLTSTPFSPTTPGTTGASSIPSLTSLLSQNNPSSGSFNGGF